MRPASPVDRLASALASATPADTALDLARHLRDEGMAQSDLLALYDQFRERHASDADETCYDAVLDAMDCIVGWCSPSQTLYPDSNATG
jgi:hypothetical protein